MTDFVNITLKDMNSEQLDLLQAAIRLAGVNFFNLYQNGILSEDYVLAYGEFFKDLGNELSHLQHDIFRSSSNHLEYCIDCCYLSVGGLLDCDPVDDPDFLKGGDKECE